MLTGVADLSSLDMPVPTGDWDAFSVPDEMGGTEDQGADGVQ